MGGGICQVSSTLYNAVIRAELEIDERSPHSMVVHYVPYASDAAIAEGTGLTLTATRPAFEPCNGQNSGDQATTPADVVSVPVSGDWTAVLNLKVNCASNGGYEFLGFYGMTDYENGVGVRAGNGSTVNFKAIGGSIESSTSGLKVSHGLTTGENHWYKLEKVGTTYTGYTSEDGETYETIFTYADTGVDAP